MAPATGAVSKVAGFTYVGAWVVGLAAFGAGAGASATGTEVAQYFTDHRVATALQSLLVHGVDPASGVANAELDAGLAAVVPSLHVDPHRPHRRELDGVGDEGSHQLTQALWVGLDGFGSRRDAKLELETLRLRLVAVRLQDRRKERCE